MGGKNSVPRVGLIGVGRFGENHLKHFLTLQDEGKCDLVFVTDSSRKRLDGLKDTHNLESTILTTKTDLIDKRKVDAVSIVVPTDKHAPLVSTCLSGKIHVFVEKPIAPSVYLAKSLMRVAAEKSLVLNVGYLFRFNPALQYAKEHLSGLGELVRISGTNFNILPPRKDSGVIMNLGTHIFDSIKFVLGKNPSHVSANRRSCYGEFSYEKEANISLFYEGFEARVQVACGREYKEKSLDFEGRKGSFKIDLLAQTVTSYDGCGDFIVKVSPERKVDLVYAELDNFLSSVRSGDTSNLGAADLSNLLICEAAFVASKKGGEVSYGFQSS